SAQSRIIERSQPIVEFYKKIFRVRANENLLRPGIGQKLPGKIIELFSVDILTEKNSDFYLFRQPGGHRPVILPAPVQQCSVYPAAVFLIYPAGKLAMN